jgi:tetratricopeptide (TPR) repeat protein
MIYFLLVWSLVAAPTKTVRGGETTLSDAEKATHETMTAELRRGRQLAAKGQHAEAVAAFDAALRAVPDEPRVLLELGWELRAAGKLPRAEEICRKAAQVATAPSERGKALYNLGRVLEQKSDKPGAIAAYRDSLKLRENRTVRERLLGLDPTAESEQKLLAKSEPQNVDDSTRCDEACTSVAICWEEVWGGTYRGGTECTNRCEEKSPPARAAFFRCVDHPTNCKAMLNCE